MDKYLTDGFQNERLIVIPENIKKTLSSDLLTKRLHVTDIGFFPQADHHRRKRPGGIEEHICIYCIKGTGWILIGDRKISVKEKEIHIIPAGTSHSYGASIEDPWSIYWFHFTGDDSNLFFQEHNEIVIKLELQKNKSLIFIELFDRIYLNLEKGYNRGNMIITSQLFGYILSILFYSGNGREDKSGKDVEVVDKSIENMRNHLNSSLSLKEMADSVNYSIPHYSALFRQKTGYSPIHYFLQLKIQRACLLLDTTMDNVSEISRRLGFEDPYYFSRLFKKIMGSSPRNYRKIKKG